jgi:hypothetical protein
MTSFLKSDADKLELESLNRITIDLVRKVVPVAAQLDCSGLAGARTTAEAFLGLALPRHPEVLKTVVEYPSSSDEIRKARERVRNLISQGKR